MSVRTHRQPWSGCAAANLLAGLLLLLSGLPRAEAARRDDFAWRAALAGSWTTGALYVAEVTADVFEGSHAFPADVRIFDENGADWPFYIAAADPGAAPPAPILPAVRGAGAEEGRRDGVLVLHLDAGRDSRPMRALRWTGDVDHVVTRMEVFGRSSSTGKWRWVAAAVTKDEPVARVALNEAAYRYFRMDVFYAGPLLPQLSGIALDPEPIHLVFEGGAGRRPFLYYGAVLHELPRYDLRRRVGSGIPGQAEVVPLGPGRRNPGRLAAALGDYGRALFLAAFVVVAGLLAVRAFRHRLP